MFKFILIGIALAFLLICILENFPKMLNKYKKYKRNKERKKKREEFRKKMEELEIK